MAKRELAGYYCPEDLFKDRIKKGTLFLKATRTVGYYPQGDGYHDLCTLPSEIVETWTPAYYKLNSEIIQEQIDAKKSEIAKLAQQIKELQKEKREVIKLENTESL